MIENEWCEVAFPDRKFAEIGFRIKQFFIFMKAGEWHYIRGLVESDIDLA